MAILPSIPLFPKPPGTIIALYFFNVSSTFSSFIFSQFTISIFTLTLLANPPCLTASITEIYESSNFTYFPTIAIVTSFSEFARILLYFQQQSRK